MGWGNFDVFRSSWFINIVNKYRYRTGLFKTDNLITGSRFSCWKFSFCLVVLLSAVPSFLYPWNRASGLDIYTRHLRKVEPTERCLCKNLDKYLPKGRGKMMVEFFSADIWVSVWRYLKKTSTIGFRFIARIALVEEQQQTRWWYRTPPSKPCLPSAHLLLRSPGVKL